MFSAEELAWERVLTGGKGRTSGTGACPPAQHLAGGQAGGRAIQASSQLAVLSKTATDDCLLTASTFSMWKTSRRELTERGKRPNPTQPARTTFGFEKRTENDIAVFFPGDLYVHRFVRTMASSRLSPRVRLNAIAFRSSLASEPVSKSPCFYLSPKVRTVSKSSFRFRLDSDRRNESFEKLDRNTTSLSSGCNFFLAWLLVLVVLGDERAALLPFFPRRFGR